MIFESPEGAAAIMLTSLLSPLRGLAFWLHPFPLADARGGIAQDYIRSVEVIWSESTPLSEWIPSYEEFKGEV